MLLLNCCSMRTHKYIDVPIIIRKICKVSQPKFSQIFVCFGRMKYIIFQKVVVSKLCAHKFWPYYNIILYAEGKK